MTIFRNSDSWNWDRFPLMREPERATSSTENSLSASPTSGLADSFPFCRDFWLFGNCYRDSLVHWLATPVSAIVLHFPLLLAESFFTGFIQQSLNLELLFLFLLPQLGLIPFYLTCLPTAPWGILTLRLPICLDLMLPQPDLSGFRARTKSRRWISACLAGQACSGCATATSSSSFCDSWSFSNLPLVNSVSSTRRRRSRTTKSGTAAVLILSVPFLFQCVTKLPMHHWPDRRLIKSECSRASQSYLKEKSCQYSLNLSLLDSPTYEGRAARVELGYFLPIISPLSFPFMTLPRPPLVFSYSLPPVPNSRFKETHLLRL